MHFEFLDVILLLYRSFLKVFNFQIQLINLNQVLLLLLQGFISQLFQLLIFFFNYWVLLSIHVFLHGMHIFQYLQVLLICLLPLLLLYNLLCQEYLHILKKLNLCFFIFPCLYSFDLLVCRLVQIKEICRDINFGLLANLYIMLDENGWPCQLIKVNWYATKF